MFRLIFYNGGTITTRKRFDEIDQFWLLAETHCYYCEDALVVDGVFCRRG